MNTQDFFEKGPLKWRHLQKNGTAPIDVSKIQKILIIQIRPWGDVLLSTSLLKPLREKFPHAQIDFFVNEPFDSIFENSEFTVGTIVTRNKGYLFSRLLAILKVMTNRYDVVIDPQNSISSGNVAKLSGARNIISWNFGRPQKSRTHTIDPMNTFCYEGLSRMRLLSFFGIEPTIPVKLEYPIHEKSFITVDNWLRDNKIERFILAAPGVNSHKQWNKSSHAEILNRLGSETGVPIVLVGAPDEHPIIQSIIELSGKKYLLFPKASYNETAALLRRAALLYCHDGSLNHLSVATETPSFAIFGTTEPLVWSPVGFAENHWHCIGKDTGEDTFGLSVETVWNQILISLSALSLRKKESKA